MLKIINAPIFFALAILRVNSMAIGRKNRITSETMFDTPVAMYRDGVCRHLVESGKAL